MNRFFSNITKGLELKEDSESNTNTCAHQEDVLDAFNSHPGIETIRRIVKTMKNFRFNHYRKIWYVKLF